MKRVSFEVAKAIKKAGYPQDCYNEYWVKFKNKLEPSIISGVEALDLHENISDETDENYVEDYYAIIEYLDVWLWLWREKHITLEPSKEGILVIECEDENCHLHYGHNIFSEDEDKDPEKAIVTAIDYLVENNLIK